MLSKRLISLVLAAVLTFCLIPFGAAAFSDIPDPNECDAADALAALGIMNGIGNDKFAPSDYLTRGQFAKLATLTLGFDEVQTYKSYTIFPDVRGTRWDAPYINAAVRKYGILQGFPDGTYRPDDKVTYGQALTILVNLLGYTIDDVGPFWPTDYITKANLLGITKGVSFSNHTEAVTRGKAAILLKNALLTKTKENELLAAASGSLVLENTILIGTYKTDPSIPNGKASFYTSSGETLTLTLKNDLPVSLVGSRGYLLTGTESAAAACSFLPVNSGSASGTVKRTYADRIELDAGTYKVPRSAMICADGNVAYYSSAWYDLAPGDTVKIFFDKNGAVELISAASQFALDESFIFGVSAKTLPDNAKIVKNGYECGVNALRKYDVVSYDSSSGVYRVSDSKMRGIYEAASPAYSYPSQITVFGNEFSVPEHASESFAGLRPGDDIILLFDARGDIAGAVRSSALPSFEQLGIMSSFSNSDVSIDLLCGVTVNGKPDLSAYGAIALDVNRASSLSQYEGCLVKVTQGTSSLSVRHIEYGSSASGKWDVSAGTIGKTAVSRDALIYEQADKNSPLVRLSLSDLQGTVIDSSDIRFVRVGASGAAELIVVSDVLDNGWIFGMVSSEKIVDEQYMPDDDGTDIVSRTSGYSITLRTPSCENVYFDTVPPDSGLSSFTPAAIPVGMETRAFIRNMKIKKLPLIGTVSNYDFDRSRGVYVDGKYVPLAEDVSVWLSSAKKFITLSEARANFDKFTVYASRALSNGGKCVLIIV